MQASVWIGFDPNESAAFAVARQSARNHMRGNELPVYGIVLADVRRQGLYTRPTELRKSAVDCPVLWDTISDAPMSTEFAVSRFLTPHLAQHASAAFGTEPGWALFTDSDVLFRADVNELFAQVDDSYAVMCVKHKHNPTNKEKMDGQMQTVYARKNWSSVCLWNLNHRANKALTLEVINTLPGRDLHRFCWLDDSEIGELGPEWNYLVGHTKEKVDPKIVHWTDGWPGLRGYENAAFADEWRCFHNKWARAA